MPPTSSSNPLQQREFQTTHWSAVLALGGDGSAARAALGELCGAYWYPLYAFTRRWGYSAQDAEDLTQGFFAQLLRQRTLGRVVRDKGRFRSFLLAAMKNFLAHERERATAQKRGGGEAAVPLDALVAENRYRAEPADTLSPERLFDRRWALTVLERALMRLEREFAKDGKKGFFDALRPTLTAESDPATYAEIAARFAMSGGALKVAVHRLRKRYRAALRIEIADTVGTTADVDGELQCLLEALNG